MAKHFTIRIKVSYDEAHPVNFDHAVDILRENVVACVENEGLLGLGLEGESVVEDWACIVEEGLA